MTLEELIDATFVGKRIKCLDVHGIPCEEVVTRRPTFVFDKDRYQIVLLVTGDILIDVFTEFTLTDVEVGE